MDHNKIIYACKEHIEIALDDYVNEEEKAPQMRIVSKESSANCCYCDKKAEYELLT